MKKIGLIFILVLGFNFINWGQNSDLSFWRKNIPTYLSESNFNTLKSKLEQDAKLNVSVNQQDYLLISASLLLAHPEASNYLNENQISVLEEYLQSSNKYASFSALRAWLNAELGFYYYTHNQFLEALVPFQFAQRDLEKLNNNELLLGDESLKKLGYYYLTIKMLPRSIVFLERTLAVSDIDSENHRAALFNLGVNHLNAERYNDAQIYLYKCLELSQKNGDKERYAKTLGEIGRIKWAWNQKGEALKLLREDIDISKENNLERNMMYARVKLGKMLLEDSELDSAQKNLELAYDYAKTQDNCAIFQEEIAHLLMELNIKKGDINNELYYRRLSDELNKMNSYRIGKDALYLVTVKIQGLVNNWEIEERNNQIQQQKVMLWQSFLMGGIIILFLLIIFIVYRRKTKKRQRLDQIEIEEFRQSKLSSEQKLKEAHSTLDSFKVYLHEKNAQIENLESYLEKIDKRSLTDKALNAKKINIEELLDSHLMTDENWELFKSAFISERPDYYDSIKYNFQDLTESNLRIILLQKLNLTNQETAHLLGITVDAVKKAKQRMRKKYGENYAKFEIGID